MGRVLKWLGIVLGVLVLLIVGAFAMLETSWARDFVAKPWDNARLLAIVRTQLELGSALRRGQRLEAENRILRGPEGAPRVIADAART